MDRLDQAGISYDVCPGVSAFCGAAAALNLEYTLPGVSQSVIITRMAGRTPVPERESIESFAAHGASMAIFLSTGMLEELSSRLMAGGYAEDTPAAIVYKATWPMRRPVSALWGPWRRRPGRRELPRQPSSWWARRWHTRHYNRSELYHPAFTTGFREAKQ